jgi:hypothetical protein
VARSSYYRRSTSILNPIAFYKLAEEISNSWSELELHYKKSSFTKSAPKLGGELRAIQLTKFSELHEQKIVRSSGHRFALITDITSFFPSLYTHTIPWALHSKPVAKAKPKDKTLCGNRLDQCSMQAQDGQTIGLPIGPDTSHILAELIGVGIDRIIEKELGVAPSGFRYVDDFYLFFDSRQDAEKALGIVNRAITAYQLGINAGKTRIIETRELAEESWKYRVKKLRIDPRISRQRDDIHHYFESLFALERAFRDESLMKYGLRQISSQIVKKSNWETFESYLIKCGYGFPNTIQTVVHIFCTYAAHGYPLNIDAIRRFIDVKLQDAALSDHHGEVSWLLWLCKELQLKLSNKAAIEVMRMDSSVCKLVLLDLRKSKLIDAAFDRSALKALATSKALTEAHWLLSYEAGRRGWLGTRSRGHILGHQWFASLVKAKVQFYDEKARLAPLFSPKNGGAVVDFDSDEDIGVDFEFEDIDEEYFDSSDSSEEDDDEDVVAAEFDDDIAF